MNEMDFVVVAIFDRFSERNRMEMSEKKQKNPIFHLHLPLSLINSMKYNIQQEFWEKKNYKKK